MKNRRIAIRFTTACLSFTLTAACMAQDSTAPKPDAKPAGTGDAQMAGMVELGKPGENHKMLETTVGSWNYKVKWWMIPGAPPMEAGGASATKSVMGGRYFITDHTGKMSMPGPDGKMMDLEFKGMSTEGYDNVKKKFVSSWIDNMGTGILLMEGTYDPATKSVTYLGEEQPAPGVKFNVREVITYTDKDHHTMDYYEVHDGTETKMMAIDYTRG